MALPAGGAGIAGPVESFALPPYPPLEDDVLPDRRCVLAALRLREASRPPLAPVPVAVAPVAVESVAVAPAGGIPLPSTVLVLLDRAPAAWACAAPHPAASASAITRKDARGYVMKGSSEV